MANMREKYEAKGYADAAASGSFRISECPYSDGWQRDAWQTGAGAWRWMQEQRKARKEAKGGGGKERMEREIKAAMGEGGGISPHLFRKARWNLYDASGRWAGDVFADSAEEAVRLGGGGVASARLPGLGGRV